MAFLDETGLSEVWRLICDKYDVLYNHWWAKRSAGLAYEPHIEASDAAPLHLFGVPSARTITYGTSVTATESGIAINNPSTVRISGYDSSYNNTFKGKYIKGVTPNGMGSTISNDVYYVDSDATFYSTTDNLYIQSGAHLVNSVQYKVYGEWSYVQSSDRNAFPDYGVVDDFEYKYLGVPFDNAVTAPKIATGSYTGTDALPTEESPMQLTFDFAPDIIMITGWRNPSGNVGQQHFLFPHFRNSSAHNSIYFVDLSMLEPDTWTVGLGLGYGIGNQNYHTTGKKTADGKTYMWARYGAMEGDSFNVAGYTYYYLAMRKGGN